MAEHENTAGDPLEEAFNAPAAEGHPEAEEAPAVADAAAGETPEPSEEAPSEDAKLAAERLDSLLRLQAEFTNFKNRAAREKEQLREFVASDIVSLLLPYSTILTPHASTATCRKAPSPRLPPSLRKLLASRAWNASARWASPSTRIFTKRSCSSRPAR